MSLTNYIWGSDGDQFLNSATKTMPFGIVMAFPDGRQFVYSQAGGTALTVGRVQQQAVVTSGHGVDLVPSAAAAVGATAVTVQNATSAITANQYQNGYLHTNDVDGEGYLYKIKSHPAEATTSGTVKITLEDGSSIQVALTTSTQLGLRKHPADEVVVAPTAETGIVVGVAVRAVTANYYCWLQTKGTCAVLTNGTVVVGESVTRGQTTAGSVDPYNEDGTANLLPIGQVETVEASTGFSLINLCIR